MSYLKYILFLMPILPGCQVVEEAYYPPDEQVVEVQKPSRHRHQHQHGNAKPKYNHRHRQTVVVEEPSGSRVEEHRHR